MNFRISWQEDRWEQNNLVKIFILGSLLVHIFIFVFGSLFSISRPRMLTEIAIEADLMSEDDLTSSKTVIPKAKVDETPSVPSNLLPQINKDFTITQPEKEAEGISDEKAEDLIPDGKQERVDAEASKIIQEEKENATKLAKLEALKRLAMEKLRQDQKEKSEELKAHDDSDLAQVKEALLKDPGLNKNVESGLLSGAASRMYDGYLTKTMRRNWALPKTFQVTDANMKASTGLVINGRGELVSVKIDTSSGNDTFDQYCIDMVKNSAPFKAPPPDLAGELLIINCLP